MLTINKKALHRLLQQPRNASLFAGYDIINPTWWLDYYIISFHDLSISKSNKIFVATYGRKEML